MLWWLKKMFKNPKAIGSVTRSSKFLAERMTNSIKSSDTVLEMGPGDGAITDLILKKLDSPTRLTLVESDDDFHAICREKFSSCNCIKGDVQKFLTGNPTAYDAIVSGIPFANMPKETRLQAFRLIKNSLHQDGRFIMFQYSLTSLEELKSIFKSVETDLVPLNIPPAFVYTCRA